MAETKKRATPTEFVTQVRQEVKKVTWPSRKETTMTVVAVLIFALLISLYLLSVDAVIHKLTDFILR